MHGKQGPSLKSGRTGPAPGPPLALCVTWGLVLKVFEPGVLMKIRHLADEAVLRTTGDDTDKRHLAPIPGRHDLYEEAVFLLLLLSSLDTT